MEKKTTRSTVFSLFKFLAVWFILIVSDTASQVFIKVGADKGKSGGPWVNLPILVGYAMVLLSFVAWMQILKKTSLSIALATSSLLYISVAVASHFFLGEKITPAIVVGTIFISTGVLLLNYFEGSKQEHLS